MLKKLYKQALMVGFKTRSQMAIPKIRPPIRFLISKNQMKMFQLLKLEELATVRIEYISITF